MLEHDPDKLFNLAVDAFGDYVKATLHSRQRTATGHDIDWMRRFSGNVHQALGSVMLPSHVANDVTVRLLTQLDMWLLQMKYESMEHCHLPDPYAMFLLTSALVHPAATHLNFLQTETYYRYSHVDKILSQDLSEMNQLKVLRLYRVPSNVQLLSFPNLQQLTLKCDDSLLESLLVTCGNIRKLHITQPFDITDAAVQFLVKFQYLEELNIIATSISVEAMTRLLTGLSKNKDSEGVSLLKSLACNRLDAQQLQLLANNFQNLVKLELISLIENCDVSFWRNLKHLRSLTFDFAHKLKQIVEVIGHQLKELEFRNGSNDVDACPILKYCPSLVCLKLSDASCSHVFEESPHINLKSLKVVHLTVTRPSKFACFILSNCTNVRVLKIRCRGNVNPNELATAMLQNNPLEHLEELHWWSSYYFGPFLPEVGRQIVRHCKNLEVIYGNIWWTRRRSRKPWFDESGVRVSISFYGYTMHPVLI